MSNPVIETCYSDKQGEQIGYTSKATHICIVEIQVCTPHAWDSQYTVDAWDLQHEVHSTWISQVHEADVQQMHDMHFTPSQIDRENFERIFGKTKTYIRHGDLMLCFQNMFECTPFRKQSHLSRVFRFSMRTVVTDVFDIPEGACQFQKVAHLSPMFAS